jgi:hypothetical protein
MHGLTRDQDEKGSLIDSHGFYEMSSRCYAPWDIGLGSRLHAVTSVQLPRFRLPWPGGQHGGVTGRQPGAACAERTSVA